MLTPPNQLTHAETLHNPYQTVHAYSDHYGIFDPLINCGGTSRCWRLVNVQQTVKKYGRTILPAMVNTRERRSWKLQLLAELFSWGGYETDLITRWR